MTERSGYNQPQEGSQPVSKAPENDLFARMRREDRARGEAQVSRSRQSGFLGNRIVRMLGAPFRWFGIGKDRV